MKEREQNKIDPGLDTPSEANTQKHINFVDMEEGNDREENRNKKDEFTEERQKQWKKGIAEGKEENKLTE